MRRRYNAGVASTEPNLAPTPDLSADVKAMGPTPGPVPAGWPLWAQTLARKYFSATISHFVLTGNVTDLVPVTNADGTTRYLPLTEFLGTELFARRDLVLRFDLSAGITTPTREMRQMLMTYVKGYDMAHGTELAQALPKAPLTAIQLLAQVVRAAVLRIGGPQRAAIILGYGEMLFPAGDLAQMAQSDRATLIALEEFVSDPRILEQDVTVITIAENLAGLNGWLLRNAHTVSIPIPYPDERARRTFLAGKAGQWDGALSEAAARRLEAFSSGLTLRQADSVLLEARIAKVPVDDAAHWFARKREIIEVQCAGLLEFFEPKYSLAMVAVHDQAIAVLKRDVGLITAGQLEAVPMGYLICGPIGVGKTFLMRCFAGEAGIPCVMLKNFRSKWQGATEANLERLLSLLRSLAPVLVVIDEADAFLGDRDNEGDSGVSNRVFSTLTSFMGDTANRGRILWALLTNRPDLLAVDLKRQGRAEQHIPLFPPSTPEHYEALFAAMLKKLKFPCEVVKLGDAIELAACTLNGADLESVIVRAYAAAISAGRTQIGVGDLASVYADFLPPVYPEKVEFQTLQGVLESTSLALIPERWRMDRKALEARLAELAPYVE